MGSDSDWGVMKKSVELLNSFEGDVELTVASAHRTPERVKEFVDQCHAKDVKIFIAAAGCAAHLAGVVASYTAKPVIGVPLSSEPFNGLDSLLSTVQMPPGIPAEPPEPHHIHKDHHSSLRADNSRKREDSYP